MTAPYWADEDVTLYLGDCLDVLRTLEADSIDAIVTDPPAGIAFMGRDWDDFRRARWRFTEWLTERMSEALRVLKPGGHLLVWSLPRTSHWTAWALEDAGLEIRDCILHLFGSGFPKSLDVSKAIDKQRDDYPAIRTVVEFLRVALDSSPLKRRELEEAFGGGAVAAHFLAPSRSNAGCPDWVQWQRLKEMLQFGDEMDAEVWRLNGRKGTPGEAWDQREVIGTKRAAPGVAFTSIGPTELDVTAPATEDAARWEGWGTALKPGQEMWWLARKPLKGTVAACVLEFGTGALNIAGCRIATPDGLGRTRNTALGVMNDDGWQPQRQESDGDPLGRWPANVVFTHSAACDGVCDPDCPAGELDRQSGVLKGGGRLDVAGIKAENKTYGKRPEALNGIWERDTGGASRFYPVFRYQAKAPASERPRLEDGTAHETVKPLGLMTWLVRLITPPGGTVLDLFAGSGPVAEACIIEGFRCVLIEQDPKSAALIRKRLSKPIQPVMFGLDG